MTTSHLAHFRDLADYNARFNRRLYDCCAGLPAGVDPGVTDFLVFATDPTFQ